MGRKKRRWRKAKARKQNPGIGKLVAWGRMGRGKRGTRTVEGMVERVGCLSEKEG